MRHRKEAVIQNLTSIQLQAPPHLSHSFSYPQLLCGESQPDPPGVGLSSLCCKAGKCTCALLASVRTGSQHSHWPQRASLVPGSIQRHPNATSCLLQRQMHSPCQNTGTTMPQRPSSTALLQASLARGGVLQMLERSQASTSSATRGQCCLIRNFQLAFAPATALP